MKDLDEKIADNKLLVRVVQTILAAILVWVGTEIGRISSVKEAVINNNKIISTNQQLIESNKALLNEHKTFQSLAISQHREIIKECVE